MRKIQDFSLLAMIILIYSTICMETDIYVPAFPDMRAFFGVSDEQIQQVLSWNFVGIFLGSLLFGPLSDSFGRKKTMQAGLGLFFITSWGCLVFQEFPLFLMMRFFQGIGAAAPMTIAFAIILDKFDSARAAQLCGILNIFITGAMAGAPMLGSILNLSFGWQANFLVIALLATLSFVGSFYGIPESLPLKDCLSFSWRRIAKDYGTVATSFPYMTGTTISCLLVASLIVFIANLSLIFIEYLGVSKSSYGFYQASTMISFALFSFVSIKMIACFGINRTKRTGLAAVSVGAMLLFVSAYSNPDPLLICFAMVVFSAGTTFAAPIYGIEAANSVPRLKGVTAGMNNAMRHIIVATIVAIGASAFDGSIRPVALLIMGSTLTAFLILSLALLRNRREEDVN